MSSDIEMLGRIYDHFNARNMEDVHQAVRDLNGNLLSDKIVGHIFRIEDGLIKRFDLRGSENEPGQSIELPFKNREES